MASQELGQTSPSQGIVETTRRVVFISGEGVLVFNTGYPGPLKQIWRLEGFFPFSVPEFPWLNKRSEAGRLTPGCLAQIYPTVWPWASYFFPLELASLSTKMKDYQEYAWKFLQVQAFCVSARQGSMADTGIKQIIFKCWFYLFLVALSKLFNLFEPQNNKVG